ncbi:hypothetical protein JKA74_18935 [Marivirga sp. S37H4]|uniref:Uncharacterized protein n=1 Tax=Marivirga aurantiaca TaxID=2802615 RepID=A0A934X296_9BACT|nr:hypothetical protein [Marivirga aurantiaca]MBK6267127.1 hypothetical protein [Marivirga aurantiaca]
MIKHFKYIAFLLLLNMSACNTEEGVTPSSTEAFLKIIPGAGFDEPVSIDVLSNGDLLIVSNNTSFNQGETGTTTKIRVVRLTQSGNKVFDKYYPESLSESWEAKQTVFYTDDKIIIGANIDEGNGLVLFQTNASGDSVTSSQITYEGENLNLIGAEKESEEDLLLLSSLSGNPAYDVRVNKLNTISMSSTEERSELLNSVPSSNAVQTGNNTFALGLGPVIFYINDDNDAALTSVPSQNFTIKHLTNYQETSKTIAFGEVQQNNQTHLFSYWTSPGQASTNAQPLVFNRGSDSDFLKGVKATSEGVLLSGSTERGVNNTASKQADFLLLKTDINGNLLFTSTFGSEGNDDTLFDAVELNNGIYAVGTTNFAGSLTMVFVKLNNKGLLIN